MNTLGFAIKLASLGADTVLVCNKGTWTYNVIDIREYVKFFNGLKDTDNIVTFISFDKDGCFLTILRSISGRGGDFLSGWLYIPNNIDITDNEIIDAYNYVCNILNLSNLSQYKDEIDEFFSKKYPQKEFVAQYLPSSGHLFGVRYLGHYNLAEIIGKNRYQPYYRDYKAVFLIDKNKITINRESANSFKDLTKADIIKYAVIAPPTSNSIQKLGYGSKIFLADGTEFVSPLFVNHNSNIKLILKREGFEPIPLNVTIQSEFHNLELNRDKVVWNKRITPSMFTLRNKEKEELKKGVRIIVNDEDITYNKGILLSEEVCRHAKIKVSATDYNEYECHCNLLQDICEFTLSRELKTTQSFIELSKGKIAKISIESKYLPSDPSKSPLPGYDYEEDYKEEYGQIQFLTLSFGYKWKQRFYGALGTLIAFLFIIGYIGLDEWIDTHHFRLGIPPWESDKTEQTQQFTDQEEHLFNDDDKSDQYLSDAIKYLDENDVWNKSKMEENPILVGLFDDMNSFELDKLLNDWKSKLKESKKFIKVCDAVNKTAQNNWNPKQNPHNPKYNQEGDELINLQNYCNWLDRNQSPQTNNETVHSGNSPSNTNKTNAQTEKNIQPVKHNTNDEQNGGL